ncbi:MAG: homoserine/threonine efflux transporter [Burkholderiales bacterium]|jgi:threonine efflux protein|nr:homoserine/threonine efflux transporter [Burkholderiales bacterium]
MMLFFTVALVHLVALMSPGPDFFFVSQTALRQTRHNALCGVLGIVLGIAIWAAIALLGLHLLLQQMAWLHKGITVVGGFYLCWLGWSMLRPTLKRTPTQSPETAVSQEAVSSTPLVSSGNLKTFSRGLFVNLSNPKALVYFGSVFSLFVGSGVDSGARWGIFLLVVAESLLWFGFVATVFAMPPMRRFYQRSMIWIDRIAGCLFIGFGLRLIFSRP